jgi:hypothetical protein
MVFFTFSTEMIGLAILRSYIPLYRFTPLAWLSRGGHHVQCRQAPGFKLERPTGIGRRGNVSDDEKSTSEAGC